MPNIPDHNSPGVKESTVKVFKQKYYVVDDVEETGYRTSFPLVKRFPISLRPTNDD